MRHLILVFLVIGSVMIFFGCQEESAFTPELSQSEQIPVSLAKPAPNLIGEVYTDFTFTPPTFWNGTIDFGVDGQYSITFISHSVPRDYSQASPFEEEFIIYELDTDWRIPENVYMKGWNAGVSSHANRAPDPMKFVANAKIETASGPFVMWEGRNVHISGTCENWVENPVFGWLPEYAEATLRIN